MKPKKERKGYNPPKKRRYAAQAVSVNPHRSTGGKRKGKSMKKDPADSRTGNILTDHARAALAIDPDATLLGTSRGVGRMLVYRDPSRIVRRDSDVVV